MFGPFYNVKSNNRVIIARPDGLPPEQALHANAERVQAMLAPYDVDAVKLVGQFNTKPDWQTDARVLTDRYSPSNLLNVPARS